MASSFAYAATFQSNCWTYWDGGLGVVVEGRGAAGAAGFGRTAGVGAAGGGAVTPEEAL